MGYEWDPMYVGVEALAATTIASPPLQAKCLVSHRRSVNKYRDTYSLQKVDNAMDLIQVSQP